MLEDGLVVAVFDPGAVLAGLVGGKGGARDRTLGDTWGGAAGGEEGLALGAGMLVGGWGMDERGARSVSMMTE